MTAVVQPMIEPDVGVIRAHLEKLFARARDEYPQGRVEIAWSDHEGKPNQAMLFGLDADQLADAAEFAANRNREVRSVYVGVNPRALSAHASKRARAGDIEVAFVHFADCDTPDSTERLRRASLSYTWAVTTGRVPSPRVQAYWDLDEPTRNLPAWLEQQRAIAAAFGSDAVIDAPRLMRLAGTVNYPKADKVARGYKVEPVTLRTQYDGAERDPVSWQAILGAFPASARVAAPATSSTGLNIVEGVTVGSLLEEIRGGRQWHNGMIRLVAHMIGRGMPDSLILALAADITLPGYAVSDTRRELQQAIEGARQKWNVPDEEQALDEPAAASTLTEDGTFPLIWFQDVAFDPATADIVEDTLGEGAMSVIYGESNCGKTFFVSDLALSIARGIPWRGKAVEQGAVIYVAAEGAAGIKKRILAYRRQHKIMGAIPFAVVTTSINLLDPKADTAPLIATIQAAAAKLGIPVRLVVIDTLARAIAGGNENASEDMGALVANADRIRLTTNAHICFIHHSGKDQAKGARGHSSLRAATDTEIEITRDADASISHAKVQKQRELEGGQQYAFTLESVEVGTNARGKLVTSCVVVPIENAPAKGPRLTPAEQRAIEQLHNAIADHGQNLGQRGPKFPNVTGCHADLWRQYVGAAGITQRDNPTNERKQWQRIREGLDAKGAIRQWDGFVWPT